MTGGKRSDCGTPQGGPHRFCKDGHGYLGTSPSWKSRTRLKQKVKVILNPGIVGAWPVVREYVYKRVLHFLTRRHKAPRRGPHRFSDDTVFGEPGVLRLDRRCRIAQNAARGLHSPREGHKVKHDRLTLVRQCLFFGHDPGERRLGL